MKKKRIVPILFVALLSTGCSGKTFEDPKGDGTAKLRSIEVTKCNTSFYTGDILNSNLGLEVTATYSDDTTKVLDDSAIEYMVAEFVSQDGYDCDPAIGVKHPGKYTASVIVTYKEGEIIVDTTKFATVEFKSVFDNLSDTCLGLGMTLNTTYNPKDKVSDNINYYLEFNWQNHGTEIYHFKEEDSRIDLTLNNGTTDVPLTTPLVRETEYTLKATYSGMSATAQFSPILGYHKVDKQDLTIDSHMMNKHYSPSMENSRIVIVPINLWSDNPSVSLEDYVDTDIPNLVTLYFGDDDSSINTISFKKYYEKLGILFDGFVTDPYSVDTSMSEAERNVLKFENVYNASRPGLGLFACMKQAFEWVKDEYAHMLNWSLYDSDSNGEIDNIHFLFNYNGTAWGTSLWPHQGFTADTSGTVDDPVVNVYCVGAKNQLNNAITQIHEQGHVFGLIDYYDYTDRSNSKINYIGHLDMQSDNIFDWNSYSKLANKLVSPYVVTGSEDEVNITIGDAATTGDCIIIPADYSTWNGSAFDEYFLVELFSNKGVNELFWSSASTLAGTEDYGVRIYHVDSRIYDMMNQCEASEDPSKWSSFLQIGANNSSDYTATGTGCPAEWGDFKQLTLIQKNGIDTFGTDPDKVEGKFLTLNDMFYAGDSLDFEMAKKFLTKSHRDDVTTMDNGETFPYTISVDAINKDEATIIVSKA
ncbi:MAG: hypothetical protein K6F07_01625 [Bacilli bacterium]|nr:hypothetical protein [Bacilli bacterium]